MLVVKNLNKSSKHNQILTDINLSFDPNEITAILGPSGSGKTTLLRCINALETIDSGEIELNGTVITQENYPELGVNIGMIFQQFHLFSNMTVIENLEYAPAMHRMKTPLIVHEEIYDLLYSFGIMHKESHYPASLSGGQKQRIAIIRAMLLDPEILFFDEPTSALDPEIIADIVKIIKELKEKKVAIVVVTHNVQFARAIADRVVFLDQGRVVANQVAADFFENPATDRAKKFVATSRLLLT